MQDKLDSVEIFPFKLQDERTGKWRRARWMASLEEVERLGGEVCGPAVTCQPLGNTSDFLRDALIGPAVRSDRVEMHPHWESPPAIDPLERFLARSFLRRYSTWCMRTRHYAQAQGAAALYRELAPD